MVRAHGVDLLDLVAERERLVEDELQELGWCGPPGEQPELLIDRRPPEEDHAHGELVPTLVNRTEGQGKGDAQ